MKNKDECKMMDENPENDGRNDGENDEKNPRNDEEMKENDE